MVGATEEGLSERRWDGGGSSTGGRGRETEKGMGSFLEEKGRSQGVLPRENSC
jgi:hypothetical protein